MVNIFSKFIDFILLFLYDKITKFNVVTLSIKMIACIENSNFFKVKLLLKNHTENNFYNINLKIWDKADEYIYLNGEHTRSICGNDEIEIDVSLPKYKMNGSRVYLFLEYIDEYKCLFLQEYYFNGDSHLSWNTIANINVEKKPIKINKLK